MPVAHQYLAVLTGLSERVRDSVSHAMRADPAERFEGTVPLSATLTER